MCTTCGCGRHDHDHGHAADAGREPGRPAGLSALALRNRDFFRARRVFALRLAGDAAAVGDGLAAAAAEPALAGRIVVVDRSRLDALGAFHAHGAPDRGAGHAPGGAPPAIDAHALGHALGRLDLGAAAVLVLVDDGPAAEPAAPDAGEHARVVAVSPADLDAPSADGSTLASADVLIVRRRGAEGRADDLMERAWRAAPRAQVIAWDDGRPDGPALWRAWLRAHAGGGRGGETT